MKTSMNTDFHYTRHKLHNIIYLVQCIERGEPVRLCRWTFRKHRGATGTFYSAQKIDDNVTIIERHESSNLIRIRRIMINAYA